MLSTRACVAKLRDAGFSDAQIADRAGLSPMTVYRIRIGRITRSREATHEKILQAADGLLEEKRRREKREARLFAGAEA